MEKFEEINSVPNKKENLELTEEAFELLVSDGQKLFEDIKKKMKDAPTAKKPLDEYTEAYKKCTEFFGIIDKLYEYSKQYLDQERALSVKLEAEGEKSEDPEILMKPYEILGISEVEVNLIFEKLKQKLAQAK